MTEGAPPIYTKTGDDGTTGLLFGGRVSKADPIVEACGTLDEATAALGLARAGLEDPELGAIVLELQRGLFAAAAEIAANPRARHRLVAGISSVTVEMTASLEQAIDALLANIRCAPHSSFPAPRRPPPRSTWREHSCAAPSDGLSPRARAGSWSARR